MQSNSNDNPITIHSNSFLGFISGFHFGVPFPSQACNLRLISGCDFWISFRGFTSGLHFVVSFLGFSSVHHFGVSFLEFVSGVRFGISFRGLMCVVSVRGFMSGFHFGASFLGYVSWGYGSCGMGRVVWVIRLGHVV